MLSKITLTFAIVGGGLILLVAGYLLAPSESATSSLSKQELIEVNTSNQQAGVSTDNTSASTVTTVQPEVSANQNQDSDPQVLQSLDKIQDILVNMDKRLVNIDERMISVEDELDIARLENENSEEQFNSESNDEGDDEYSAQAIAEQEKLKQYFSNLDQSFQQTSDEEVTTRVQSTFDTMIASRPVWQNDTSIQSTHCGTDRCKVVLRYKNDMDPIDKFEFEGMALVYLGIEMPQSVIKNKTNADGTTDMTLYFAKKEVELPLPE